MYKENDEQDEDDDCHWRRDHRSSSYHGHQRQIVDDESFGLLRDILLTLRAALSIT